MTQIRQDGFGDGAYFGSDLENAKSTYFRNRKGSSKELSVISEEGDLPSYSYAPSNTRGWIAAIVPGDSRVHKDLNVSFG